MQIDFLTVFIAVISLVILALPGYILAKTKLLPDKASEAFSALVLYGCQPMLVFMGFQGERFRSDILINMLIVVGVSVVVHLLMIAIMYISIKKKGDEVKRRCVRAGSVFSNCGYMGLPFLQTLFSGSSYIGEIIVYAAVVISVFNVLNWTFGVYMITKDKRGF